MLRDVPLVVKEIIVGLFWPINAPLDWAIKNLVIWVPNNLFKVLELTAIVIAVVAFLFELDARREERSARTEERDSRAEERLVRMWDLATDPRPGNSGKIPALEFLNKLEMTLAGISIPKAYLAEINLKKVKLSQANLSEANFFNADLQGASFHDADLRNAYLVGANLRSATFFEANLAGANLNGADLHEANLTGVNLTGAFLKNTKGLTQSQLKAACVAKNGKLPYVPVGLTPPEKVCGPLTRQ
jgi:hypothetical protein